MTCSDRPRAAVAFPGSETDRGQWVLAISARGRNAGVSSSVSAVRIAVRQTNAPGTSIAEIVVFVARFPLGYRTWYFAH